VEDALAQRLCVRSQFQNCTLLREVSLNRFAPRIDFTTTLEDFAGGDVMIKASFPLAIDWSQAEHCCETPFAATPKPDGHFAAQTWADCSDHEWGAALLNYGTPGYWAGGGRLELVLLRSFANYTGYQEQGRKHGLPVYEWSTDTALAAEHGTHTFRYSLLPHHGDWRTADLSRVGQGMNVPFVVLAGVADPGQAESSSLVSCEPDFILTAVKLSEDGHGLVVRGFETRGQAHPVALRVAPWVSAIRQASLLEEPEAALPLRDGIAEFTVAPHEIVTLLLLP
jgi:alpha-mannosidase